jgi:hypothetical protein
MELALVYDGRGKNVDGDLVHTIRDMEHHQTIYARGHSMLAHLYYDLE